ncbi:hypothetical protein GSI_06486 [Ganoderma sinense ZZ0214-1]|uniref:Uncharacterized protein n=1 Tax=Ganoderma sinense ZZ0214-1 TaxID=1077348 RepID=A0A2G8SDF0_9APHY|nr:hypothetical protein GSI_06486 [Ganoderma sinense ZZ0214-1]
MSNGAESMIPSSGMALCSACGHAWYSHLLESLPSLHPSPGQQRGTCIPETNPTAGPAARTLANCGGFYSSQNPSQWTYTSICVCERMFHAHGPFTVSGGRFNIPSLAPAPAAVGVNSPALFPGSAGVAQQAPCIAYQGLRSENINGPECASHSYDYTVYGSFSWHPFWWPLCQSLRSYRFPFFFEHSGYFRYAFRFFILFSSIFVLRLSD